ncbi:VCBS repeat-containing protein [Vitiosangium sp. GDMCC 1.1324]|uniref:FG-GAP repeat domain-containing protein n=1 Tax=Vitiosangium sp. (strain GDMCC 1.1324) TaxID=2138576 RepID=UPI00130EDA3B|nr:VCBS repeat-containing protein [Vitiosangium sp. GDMCC 1.1324]
MATHFALLGCTPPAVTPPKRAEPTCARTSLRLDGTSFRELRLEDVTGDGHGDLAVLQDEGFLVLFAGQGDSTFAAPRKYSVGPTPRDIAVADINEDGKKDLLVVGHFSNALTVLLGTGGGDFQEARSYPLGNHSQKLRLADFNADGHLDVVTKNAGSGGFFNITVLMGRGDGSFAAAVPYPTTGLPRDLGIADIDSDGRTDVLVAITNQNVVDVFRGQADGTLSAPARLDLSEDPLHLELFDVNGDAAADLLVSHGLASPGHLSIYLNQGEGTFGPERRVGLDSPDAFVSLHLDGDGTPDLAVSTLEGAVLLLKGTGDGSFSPASAPLYQGNWPTALAVGTLDGDAHPDMAWLTSKGEVEITHDIQSCVVKLPE